MALGALINLLVNQKWLLAVAWAGAWGSAFIPPFPGGATMALCVLVGAVCTYQGMYLAAVAILGNVGVGILWGRGIVRGNTRPSYQRLVSLNPLLVQKSAEAVGRLIDVMEQHGMEWDERNQYFVHRATGISVRTQGLDMFVDDPQQWVESFRDVLGRREGREGG